MPSFSVQTWEVTRPLGTDYDLVCKNNESDVNPNKCEFSCKE
jgi:hypothetical protein